MAQITFEEKRQQTAARLGMDPNHVPRNIAIVMDGNGRWAQERGKERYYGHSKGASIVEKIAIYCVDLGIEYLTLYSFSMQNWSRPKEEIDFLMDLYAMYLEGIRDTLMKHNVRLAHLGRKEGLPQKVIEVLEGTIEITSANDGMTLGLALNYGSRTEIVDAAKAIAQKVKSGQLDIDQIDRQCISDNLYTAGWPDVDLLIRTSGELRISNFLLWQISYAEFYVTDKYWPDFEEADLDASLQTFAARSRRMGDVLP
ncbi:MAG: isoprenyl transferase [Planctomycetes bacterium]|nr:isoprenyl transferase [Planctomycetota bacterium]